MSSPTISMTMMQAAPAGPGGSSQFIIGLLPWLLIFVIFYVLMIRPQQRRVKAHQAALAAVRKGDEVVTGGGIRGRITRVGDDEVEVEIAPNVRIQVVKATITHVLTTSAKPAND